jgi:hypothetical protein
VVRVANGAVICLTSRICPSRLQTGLGASVTPPIQYGSIMQLFTVQRLEILFVCAIVAHNNGAHHIAEYACAVCTISGRDDSMPLFKNRVHVRCLSC